MGVIKKAPIGRQNKEMSVTQYHQGRLGKMENGILSHVKRCSHRRAPLSRGWGLWALIGLFLLSSVAYGAEISFNASQDPNNTIQLSGDLAASVEYTANGLKIEIPGVMIKLSCDGTEVSEEAPCTIDLTAANDGGGPGDGSGDGSGAGGGSGDGSGDGSGNGGGSGDGSGDGSGAGGGSGDGSANVDCSKGPDQPFLPAGVYEQYCDEDGNPKEGADNGTGGGEFGDGSGGGGFTPGEGIGNNKEDDTCGANGFDPTCAQQNDNTSDVEETRDPFPNDPRVVFDRTVPQADRFKENRGQTLQALDFGSASDVGRGSAQKFIIPKGEVMVLGFTTGGDEFELDEDGNPTEVRVDPTAVRISYAPGTTPAGAFLHLWLSETKDGERVSEECSQSGYGEGKFLISVDGTQECNVERETTYYLMGAYCNPEDDYNCSTAKAVTGLRNGQVVLDSTWWRQGQ